MSELIKYTAGQLTTEAGQVLKAYEGQPGKDTNDSDLYAVVQRLVQETAEAVGHKPHVNCVRWNLSMRPGQRTGCHCNLAKITKF